MAISWGSWVDNGSGNGMRVGIDFTQSPSSVSSGTSSVTVTLRVYVETRASVSDSTNTLKISGDFDWSGDVSISHGGGGGTTLVRAMSRSVSTSYSGTRSTSASVSLTGINAIPGTATESASHTTAKRPVTAPKAVSNLKATRSGTSIKLAWSRNPTTGQPYDRIRVRCSTNGGDYVDVATLSGGATSYTHASRTPGQRYRYAVRAENDAGNSAWVYSPVTDIPPNPPAAPSNATVTRSSDSRQVVKWSRGSSPSTAPITQQVIARWEYATGAWKNIATVSGSVTSFTDSSTKANAQYRYRVQSKNTSGTSSWAYTDYVSTTPKPPTTIVAQKRGEDIKVTWTNTTGTRITGIEIWLTEAGVDQSPVHLQLTGAPTSWTHISPDPTKTWQYRLKTQSGADTNDVAPNLYSGFSTRSNIVQLIAPPAAPTRLSPSASAIDGADESTFAWFHNPVDTTDQSAYELDYRVNGGAWVGTGKVTSENPFHEFAPDTFENGTTLEWRVRTWGAHANPSPYSTITVVTVSSRPSVTILVPNGEEGTPTVTSSSLTAEWEYFDPEDTLQTMVRLALSDANNSTVWAETLSMSSTSYQIPYALADGASYGLSVSVRDAAGLWSYPAQQPFDVVYAKPPVPTVGAVWNLDLGGVVISIDHPVPDPPVTYDWAAGAHASASVRQVNGMEVARNYAVNPSFETTGLNWIVGLNGANSATTVAPHRGTQSLKTVFAAAGTFKYGGQSAVIPPGFTFMKASIAVKNVAGAGFVRLRVGYRDAETSGAVTYGPMGTGVETRGEWTILTISQAIPATTKYLAILAYGVDSVRGSANPAGTEIHIDSLCITLGASEAETPEPAYFDGDTADVPGEAEATSADLQHSADGEEWETIAPGLDPTTSTVDFIPVLDTVNYYRVISYSDMPSSLESAAIPVLVESNGWVFVNGGPDWSYICRIRDNVKTDHSTSREKILNRFAGRAFPVMTTGEARSRGVSISGNTSGGGSTSVQWEELQGLGEPVCYREPGPAYGGSGDKFMAAFMDFSRSRERVFESVSLSFERVEEV